MPIAIAPGTHDIASRLPAAAVRRAILALLARDLTVLRKRPANFIVRTVVQPLMYVFVFGYVSVKVGQGTAAGGTAAGVATTLLAGMLAMVLLFQGIFSVAMPLLQEFGYTREIEDRVQSPLTVSQVALMKVLAGAIQGLLAAVVVFPLAMFVPSARPDLDFHWPVLLTVAPLAAIMCSSLGLFLGTALGIENVTAGLTVLLVPLMFLGCTFYPWSALHAVPWVQWISLLDPLTYVSEGFRAAVTPAQHLSLLVTYPVLGAFTGLLTWQGVRHFRRRIVS